MPTFNSWTGVDSPTLDGQYAPPIAQINTVGIPATKVGFASLNVATTQVLNGFLSSFANADYAEWPVMLQSGTYQLMLIGVENTDSPIIDVSLDGVVIATYDQYNAALTWNVVEFTNDVVVSDSGQHLLRVTIDGKNASSSAYTARISYLQLIRTGA